MTLKSQHPAIGSSLEDFLKTEGISDDRNTQAIKEVLVWQLEQVMKEKKISKLAMADKMNTSRAALNRLLDPKNTAVTLNTMMLAATTIGKNIKIELV